MNDSARKYFESAKLKSSQKDFIGAIDDYTIAIHHDNLNTLLFNNRGCCRNKIKQYDKAIEDFNRAIEINPSLGVCYTNRAFAYKELQQIEFALDDFKKAYCLGDKRHEGWLLILLSKKHNIKFSSYRRKFNQESYNVEELLLSLEHYNKAVIK
jgi:tetratricopeptide (TPR) repeat protein